QGPEWAVSGVFTLFAVLFFFVGAQFIAFGLLGEYVGRIFQAVRERPAYVLRDLPEEREARDDKHTEDHSKDGGGAEPVAMKAVGAEGGRANAALGSVCPAHARGTRGVSAIVFAYHDVGCMGLRVLHKLGVEIAMVYTHADDPTENTWFGSVRAACGELGIPV